MLQNESNSSNHIARIESAKNSVRKYFGIISIIISLVIASIFFTFQFNVSKALKVHLYKQSKVFFSEIVIVRKWIAQHGGVYVPLDKTTGENPYLAEINGVKSKIFCDDREFVLKNPSLVTRELSESPFRTDQIRYKMTSLDPINPDNAPDKFERSALEQFEEGVSEVSAFEKREDVDYFRYMAPLVTDKTCMTCHAQQGYNIGDIRGGISVTLQADDLILEIKTAQIFMVIAGIGVIALIVASIWYISRFFIRDLHNAQEALSRMASTDFLTGLANRMTGVQTLTKELGRTFRKNTPLCIALIDLDYFKKVNDMYGHNVGDEILKKFSTILLNNIRNYDTACRYGGEEFLLIMPQTSLEEAILISNRVLKQLKLTPILTSKGDIQTSMSAGVVMAKEGDNVDVLVDRADSVLYRAKGDGRSRIYGDI
ncbi:diguanylate cyclase [Desulfomicrobium sp. ZS1]|uniref:diguanylate cyclase n=1 Tax=Desulfomicrobium sp. ZS1 TaxID=2952228 RepID=UPI0020B1DA12|nr:diguanylate cyclase [Desulfomicrobium sp. ZS1]UTF51852.1 diguanylate cyclase [Desulfomicrobium sp. ZS1]